MLVRVAIDTGTDIARILAAPYARTRWTYLHLLQRELLTDIDRRSHALYGASLMTMGFHEPKRLGDERRRLLVDAKMVAPVEESHALALALVADVARVDRADAWKPMGEDVS